MTGSAENPPTGPHRVAVLVRDGVMPLELGLVHQMFGSAEAAGRRLYEVVTCALRPGPVRTDADFPVLVERGPEALDDAATVVVPASHAEDAVERAVESAAGNADENAAGGAGEGEPSAELRAALGRVRPDARVASVCTGAFVLAAVGLLDGRRATTHWKSAEQFRRRFPAVRLQPDVLYTEDRGVLTSAGEAAGIDLCLHMIRADHGAAVANDVARRTVVPPHRDGGQAQYVSRPVAEPELSTTGRARAWALAHLDRPIALRELAARESMSVRTFSRRFREETGVTPLQWLTRQRIERARHLLEETDRSVDRVAADAGFGTAASLRQHMQAALGVSPTAYRGTFRGPGQLPAGAAA
ncbi:helix-turn-helix domain-containing protein [Streptomyces sp. B5E4]|uniref:GlxA family transcriptional regulator n=1 Tax=Streptomyces sp. B5E4 TaxID=3153568 RepID=UPI00325EF20A